jgi:hypothetical protein
MTVANTTRKAGPYAGNGSTTVFPFSFKVYTKNDIAVYLTSAAGVVTTLVLDSDYSVSVNGNQAVSPGGTITYPLAGTALPSGATLTLTGSLAYNQVTQLPAGGAYNASNVEDALDRGVILTQQLLEAVTRAVQLPVSYSSAVNSTLPLPEANKVVGWNAAGTGLQNTDPATLATVVSSGTTYSDVFTGNGVQTVWTLSANPGTLQNLSVSIGGVTQLPTVDYVWSAGTAMTTTSPVPSGVKMLVKYQQALPQGGVESYLLLGSASGLSNSRVLTAGSGVSFSDAGPGSSLTISATGGASVPVAGSTTLSAASSNSVLYVTGSQTITLPAFSSLPEYWNVKIVNGNGVTTIVCSGSDVMTMPRSNTKASIRLPYSSLVDLGAGGTGVLTTLAYFKPENANSVTLVKIGSAVRAVSFDDEVHGVAAITHPVGSSTTWTVPNRIDCFRLTVVGPGGANVTAGSNTFFGGAGAGAFYDAFIYSAVAGTVFTAVIGTPNSANGSTTSRFGGSSEPLDVSCPIGGSASALNPYATTPVSGFNKMYVASGGVSGLPTASSNLAVTPGGNLLGQSTQSGGESFQPLGRGESSTWIWLSENTASTPEFKTSGGRPGMWLGLNSQQGYWGRGAFGGNIATANYGNSGLISIWW